MSVVVLSIRRLHDLQEVKETVRPAVRTTHAHTQVVICKVVMFVNSVMWYLLVSLLFTAHHSECVVSGVLEDMNPADGLRTRTGR